MAAVNASLEVSADEVDNNEYRDRESHSERRRSRSSSPQERVNVQPHLVEARADAEIYSNVREQSYAVKEAHVAPKESSKAKGTTANKGEPCLTMNDKSDRDPNRIAENVRVTFEDIIAEPDETLYSFDQVWSVSKLVYTETKLWVYRVVTLLLGVIVAILWGLVFALISFCASWLCVPCMKCYRLIMSCCKPYYVITLDCAVEPLVLILSKLFYNIRVSHSGSQA